MYFGMFWWGKREEFYVCYKFIFFFFFWIWRIVFGDIVILWYVVVDDVVFNVNSFIGSDVFCILIKIMWFLCELNVRILLEYGNLKMDYFD